MIQINIKIITSEIILIVGNTTPIENKLVSDVKFLISVDDEFVCETNNFLIDNYSIFLMKYLH